jgi:hypothetical protein
MRWPQEKEGDVSGVGHCERTRERAGLEGPGRDNAVAWKPAWETENRRSRVA